MGSQGRIGFYGVAILLLQLSIFSLAPISQAHGLLQQTQATVDPAVRITTVLTSVSITVGQSVNDSATLVNATSNAGGTVTYEYFPSSGCSGNATVVGSPVTVTNGIVPSSVPQKFDSPGFYGWEAVYSGDNNNNAAKSSCEPLAVTVKVAIDPTAIIQLGQTSGTISVSLNVTNSPPIHAFVMSIGYNYLVLHTQSVDYSNGILGVPANNWDLAEECLDGRAVSGLPCDYPANTNAPGVDTMALSILGNQSTPVSSGRLFQITFQVVAPGFSRIDIIFHVLAKFVNVAASVPVSTADGYYTSIDCPSGSNVACKPPVASFTVRPSLGTVLRQDNDIIFNASASRPTNTNAKLTEFHWYWGDGTVDQDSFPPSNSTALHRYSVSGNFTVLLIVTDSYSISSSKSLTFYVSHFLVQVAVGDIRITPGGFLYPGVILTITPQAENVGTLPAAGNLTVFLEGKSLGPPSKFNLTANEGVYQPSVSWNTTGYTPRVYRIDVVIPRIANETDTSSNQRSAWVLLLYPAPVGGLNLLETTGIGILVLVAVGIVIARLRKKPNYITEPLQ